jgi:hypothetical protein
VLPRFRAAKIADRSSAPVLFYHLASAPQPVVKFFRNRTFCGIAVFALDRLSRLIIFNFVYWYAVPVYPYYDDAPVYYRSVKWQDG